MKTTETKSESIVSVIVPVYNSAPWLEECLDSIANQTLSEVEIICVNDGSTDDSLRILEEYQRKDGRIRIIDQKNKGVGAARNEGMKAATGKYLYFIDSDDYIDLNALELLTADMEERNLELICFNTIPFGDDERNRKLADSKKSYYNRTLDEDTVFTGTELFCVLRKNQNYLVPVWLNMVLRSYCMENDIWFRTDILHEDEAWTFEAMMGASRCGCMNKAFYHRRYRDNSIMTSPMSFKHVYSYWYAITDMLQTIEKRKIQGETLETVIMNIESLQRIAIDNYMHCADEERGKSALLPAKDQVLVQMLIAHPAQICARLEQSNAECRKKGDKLAALEKELGSVKDSNSYRLGRMLTWPYRKMKELGKNVRRKRRKNE